MIRNKSSKVVKIIWSEQRSTSSCCMSQLSESCFFKEFIVFWWAPFFFFRVEGYLCWELSKSNSILNMIFQEGKAAWPLILSLVLHLSWSPLHSVERSKGHVRSQSSQKKKQLKLRVILLPVCHHVTLEIPAQQCKMVDLVWKVTFHISKESFSHLTLLFKCQNPEVLIVATLDEVIRKISNESIHALLMLLLHVIL